MHPTPKNKALQYSSYLCYGGRKFGDIFVPDLLLSENLSQFGKDLINNARFWFLWNTVYNYIVLADNCVSTIQRTDSL